MTYCNSGDIFLYNGQLVRCTRRLYDRAELLDIATGKEMVASIKSAEFQTAARPVLHTLKFTNPQQVLSIDEIAGRIAEIYGVPVETMKKKTRKREVVVARQVCMTILKMLTRHSLKAIGDYFGKRDHTTVIHSMQTVNALCRFNADFRDDFENALISCRNNQPLIQDEAPNAYAFVGAYKPA